MGNFVGGFSMSEFSEIRDQVEAEYDTYCSFSDWGERYDTVRLFELLSVYLKLATRSLVRANPYINEYDIEDIVNDALVDIFESGLKKFQKKEAAFTTFCYAVAKNKVRNWHRNNSRIYAETSEKLTLFSEQKICEEIRESDTASPEEYVLKREHQLEAIYFLKKYIQTVMDWNWAPYRSVSCSFSLVLFHRYFPTMKRKSYPGWAFSELEHALVRFGAERFETELKQWMPDGEFAWKEEFWQSMEKPYGNTIATGNLVFGENFDKKDFSNWAERMDRQVKDYLLGNEVRADASFKI